MCWRAASAGDLFSFRTPTELADRFRVLLNILALQWNAAFLFISLVAIVPLALRRWRIAAFVGRRVYSTYRQSA